jgi:hypothetical protein
VKLAYVDESGTEGESDWFILTAFIIDSEDWMVYNRFHDLIPNKISRKIENLKELRHPHDEISHEDRHETSENLYRYMNLVGYKVISIITEQEKAMNFCPKSQIYPLNFTYLVERIEYYLNEVEDVGVIFVDERDDKTPRELQDLHYELKSSGSRYAEFYRTIGAAAPLRDEESIPMTFADWVSSAIRQHFVHGNSDYYKYIVDNVQRNPKTGRITGAGIKLIPDDAASNISFDPEKTSF